MRIEFFYILASQSVVCVLAEWATLWNLLKSQTLFQNYCIRIILAIPTGDSYAHSSLSSIDAVRSNYLAKVRADLQKKKEFVFKLLTRRLPDQLLQSLENGAPIPATRRKLHLLGSQLTCWIPGASGKFRLL